MKKPTSPPRWWKSAVLWYIGGMLYVGLELLFRQWSHPSMFVLGGLCFLLLDELGRTPLPLWFQSLFGALMVTALELWTGILVNLRLGWQVWDYSHVPLNFMGQICLPFSLLWVPVCGMGLLVDRLLRRHLFHEQA